MKVSEIMRKAFVIDDDISVKEAAKLMASKEANGLIVMKNDKIEGIITEKDITNNVSRLGMRVSEIMKKNVITIEKNETIDEAARIMKKNKIKKLPIMDKGELVGMITADDLIENSDDLNEEFFID